MSSSYSTGMEREKEKREEKEKEEGKKAYQVLPVREPLLTNPGVLPLEATVPAESVHLLFARRLVIEVAEFENGGDGAGNGEGKIDVERRRRRENRTTVRFAVKVGFFAVVNVVLMLKEVGKRADERLASGDVAVLTVSVAVLVCGAALRVTTDEEGGRLRPEGSVVILEVLEDLVGRRKVVFGCCVEDEFDDAEEEVEAVFYSFLLDERKSGIPISIVHLAVLLVLIVIRIYILEVVREERLEGFEGEESGKERVSEVVVVLLIAKAVVADAKVLKTLVLTSLEALNIFLLRLLGFISDGGALSGFLDGGSDFVPNCIMARRGKAVKGEGKEKEEGERPKRVSTRAAQARSERVDKVREEQ
jgi:hypothetical protein